MYAKQITLDGAGLLYEKFDRLKRELEEMGMFALEVDMSRRMIFTIADFPFYKYGLQSYGEFHDIYGNYSLYKDGIEACFASVKIPECPVPVQLISPAAWHVL